MLRDVSFSVIYFPLFATLNDLGPRKSDGSGEKLFTVISFFFAWFCLVCFSYKESKIFKVRRYFGVHSCRAALPDPRLPLP